MKELDLAEISLTGDQMLEVLELVAKEGPLSAAEAARQCGINRTVAHRLLTTLAKRAYVRRTEDGYTVGPGVLRLAHEADRDLRAIAKPVMVRLAQETGETAVLHCIDNLEAVVVDQALGERHLVRVQHTPGSRHPLVRGASGWALLAFQDDKFIERVLRISPDPEQNRERIAAIKSEGFAVTHNELQLDVHGIAVPLLRGDNACEASLAILVPSARAASLPSLHRPLVAAAREIAKALT